MDYRSFFKQPRIWFYLSGILIFIGAAPLIGGVVGIILQWIGGCKGSNEGLQSCYILGIHIGGLSKNLVVGALNYKSTSFLILLGLITLILGVVISLFKKKAK